MQPIIHQGMIRFAAIFCLFSFTILATPPLPLVFERNMGLAAPETLYIARSVGYEIRLETGGVSLVRGVSTFRMRLDESDPAPQIRGCEPQAARVDSVGAIRKTAHRRSALRQSGVPWRFSRN
jgi:hypothetical protein